MFWSNFLKYQLANSIANVQQFEEITDNHFSGFCESYWAFDNLDEMFHEIEKFDIKIKNKKHNNKTNITNIKLLQRDSNPQQLS